MKSHLIAASCLIFSAVGVAQECSPDITKSAANTRYVYSEQGTIKDKLTGLTWMRCQVGKTWNAATEQCDGEATGFRWQSALQEVAAINHPQSRHALHQFASQAEWRLPNIKELVSLTEMACFGPAMNSRAFAQGFKYETGNILSYLWSQSPHLASGQVWSFDSVNGEIYHYAPNFEFGVLLVAEE
ncbi:MULTISPECIES: Lcl C-terminal domain-containing protein [unclassified Vibrio]|uniref:Lcl C-terminal domain-containing protein n=1 Tax=unclassified Vibrio TaxID=2614977 RepID=UPI000B8EB073|nr:MULTISPECIES: DUF1566 domain-containing protein [unclassified Vibrio]NAW98365.1 DUF1566 domain-containing protein [Vibrio sp. V23_P3S9T160]OXX48721.1 HutR like protein [Vibrio sp. V11_P1A41T118]